MEHKRYVIRTRDINDNIKDLDFQNEQFGYDCYCKIRDSGKYIEMVYYDTLMDDVIDHCFEIGCGKKMGLLNL